MDLHQLFLTKNLCYKRGDRMTPRGIMVHSTGANNPKLSRYVGPDDGLLGRNPYNNHWNRADATLPCVHAFIGKLKDGSVATYQTLPWDMQAWHCGSSGNNTHIAFEICEDDLTDKTYFEAVYKEAAELCAYLCKTYKLSPSTVICHKEGYQKGIASNHADVLHWWPRHGKNMDDFRADVAELLGEEPAPEPDPAKEITVGSRVEIVRDTYWPGGPTVSERARDGVHTVSSLTYAGKPVTKGGEKCVLLGDIATWAAVSNLKLEGVVAPEPEPTPIAPAPPGIEAGSRVHIKAKTYWPGGPTVPLWVRAVTHVVTRTSYNGKTVEKGGKPCVLLGRKVNLFGTEVSGINTWVATENLEAANG